MASARCWGTAWRQHAATPRLSRRVHQCSWPIPPRPAKRDKGAQPLSQSVCQAASHALLAVPDLSTDAHRSSTVR
eukprot:scaffold3202_cov407-Prasinococcus_capsulatus_cf.AAC.22